MRRFLVDTGSTITFFSIVAAVTEFFIAGLEPQEVVTTRLLMIPIMVLTGRPYGLWRDWAFRTVAPAEAWTRALTDAGAFVTFQLPIYGATLVVAGADLTEILVLFAAVLPQMLILSRPFGLFLELMRRLAGVPQASSGTI